MTKNIVLGTLVVIGLLTSAMASYKKDTNALFEKKGDKERIYKVPIETMWKACMKAAAEDNCERRLRRLYALKLGGSR